MTSMRSDKKSVAEVFPCQCRAPAMEPHNSEKKKVRFNMFLLFGLLSQVTPQSLNCFSTVFSHRFVAGTCLQVTCCRLGVWWPSESGSVMLMVTLCSVVVMLIRSWPGSNSQCHVICYQLPVMLSACLRNNQATL